MEKQVRLLYAQAPGSLLVSTLVAILIAGYSWNQAGAMSLVAWLLAMVIINLVRFAHVRAFQHRSSEKQSLLVWRNGFVMASLFAGLTWGALGYILDVSWPKDHQVLVLMALAGISAGAIPAYAVVLPAYLIFVLAAMTPLGIMLLNDPGHASNAMGWLVILFSIFLIILASKYSESVKRSLILGEENQDLADSLRVSNDQLRVENEKFRQAEAARNRSEKIALAFDHLLDESLNEIYIFDAESLKFLRVNRGARQNLGYSNDELKQMTALDLKPELSAQEFAFLLKPLMEGEQEEILFVTQHQRKDGSLYPVEVNLQRANLDETPVLVAMILDITERLAAEEKIKFLAYHDSLTSLPNRALFNDRLSQAIQRAERENTGAALLLIDLDLFKQVNDEFGHQAGDLLLQQVGEAIKSCIRAVDTVARMGGDEFAVILEGFDDHHGAVVVAERIRDKLCQPFVLAGQQAVIGSSIGISLYPQDAQQAELLIKHADWAMYQAKNAGRNGYSFYNDAMN